MSLLVNREGRLLRLTLNRPEKRNAIDSEMCTALVNEVDRAQNDAEIGAVLIDAAGAVFCAGMDLDEATAPEAASRTAIHEQLFTMGVRSVKPIVAAVQGPALGGGTGLVANAHVVIAAQGTSFGLTEIRIAMWPYVIFRAMRTALGERRATELALTGRIFTAPEALQCGLVSEIAPAFELDDRATAVANQLASASPEVLQRGLAFVHRTREMDDAAAGVVAREMRASNFSSPDFHEGVRAFKEKRKPSWPSLAG